MMTRFKTNLLLFPVTLACFSVSVQAQVTIGSGIKPAKGALLDLKEYTPTTENITSTKGILLPRVKLESESDLMPVLAGGTSEEKLVHTGLQVFHVGGNHIKAGLKVWNGTSWCDMLNTNLNVENGLDFTADTLKLGGELSQNTQIKGRMAGTNLEYNSTNDNANFLITGNAKLGVNTTSPEATADINGTLRVANIPVKSNEGVFRSIGVNDQGIVVRENDAFTSFSKYLGFDPMAPEHTVVLPFSLEAGYLYTIEGFSVGACYGVITHFTINFIGERYLGTTLQAIPVTNPPIAGNPTGSQTQYTPITLSPQQTIFGTPLEVLANASGCTQTSGHTLTYLPDTKQIQVTYRDNPAYFPDAGTFAITRFVKLKI